MTDPSVFSAGLTNRRRLPKAILLVILSALLLCRMYFLSRSELWRDWIFVQLCYGAGLILVTSLRRRLLWTTAVMGFLMAIYLLGQAPSMASLFLPNP